MQYMYINEDNKTLETLSYSNKRAMEFEVFNSNFQNAVNILDSYIRTMHNEYVVDLLWTKLINVELGIFVASIKVDYRRNRQKYTNILKKKETPRLQLVKHHRSQRLGYWNSRQEEKITAINHHALQKENIFLMVRSTPYPIRLSSEWINQLTFTTKIFVQVGKRDEASRNQTTTIKVGNKN